MTFATTYDTLVNPYTIFNGAVEITNGSTLTAGWYVTTNIVEKLILVLESGTIVHLTDNNKGRWDLYNKVITNQNVTPLKQISTNGSDTISVTVTPASQLFNAIPKNYQAFASGTDLYIAVDGDAYKIVDGTLDNSVDVKSPHNLAFNVKMDLAPIAPVG